MRVGNSDSGFGLIEVLIAVIVLGVGLLSVALFSNSVFTDSSASKSRAEAIALGQQRIEALRTLAASSKIASLAQDALATTSSAVTGVNASYVITPTVAGITSGSISAIVNVSWINSRGGDESIELNTQIAENLLGAVSTLSGTAGPPDNPYAISVPTGQAEYGADAPGGVLPEVVRVDNELLNTRVQSVGSGVKLIYDNSNNTEAPEEERRELELLRTSLNAFSEIRGIVYVDNDTVRLDTADLSKLIIRASDTGVCPKSDPINIPDSSDWFVEYICFFGAGWYGNIDVVYTDPSLNTGQVALYRNLCMGDHAYVNDGTDLSRHADWIEALDPRREYRGYGVAVISGENDAVKAQNGNLIYVAQGIGEGDIYGYGGIAVSGAGAEFQQIIPGDYNHDFMLVKMLSGNPDPVSDLDSYCSTRLFSATAGAYSGNLPGASSGAFTSFESNYRDFVCLRINNVYSCPADIPDEYGAEVTSQLITISGSISGPESVASTSISSQTSQFPSGSINKCYRNLDGDTICNQEMVCTYPSSSNYECNVWVASGASWSGTLFHSSSDFDICSPSNGIQTIIDASAPTASGAPLQLAETGGCSVGSSIAYTLQLTNLTNIRYDLRNAVISISGVNCSVGNNVPSSNNPWRNFDNGDSGEVADFCVTTDPISSGTMGSVNSIAFEVTNVLIGADGSSTVRGEIRTQ